MQTIPAADQAAGSGARPEGLTAAGEMPLSASRLCKIGAAAAPKYDCSLPRQLPKPIIYRLQGQVLQDAREVQGQCCTCRPQTW